MPPTIVVLRCTSGSIETRPRNQGARLTAWELGQHGVPHTIIADNVGGHLMQHGLVDLVITGSDRTTYTGDVANKIGTYLKALAAWDNRIPFYVALPSSTFDWKIRDGVKEIPIEQRDETEVKFIPGLSGGEIITVLLAPEDSPAGNYAFDVTPARLVTGLITERGICQASEEGVLGLYPEKNHKLEIGMAYQALDTTNVIDYIKNRPAMQRIFPSDACLSAKEVGDGNLNLVFIVQEEGNAQHSAVLKQALPYLRVAGESWPLTRERMRFETQALLLHNQLAPGLAPEVYDHDEEMSLVIMEYLGQHEVMRMPLVRRVRFPKFVDHISTFMARTLFFTSDLYLTGVEKKELQAKYMNPHLCKIQEDFVFTNPYMESPENKWNPAIDAEVQAVRRNSRLKLAIAEVKESYMTHAQSLIHSDLHTGSIMLNQDDTRVIDPEFAFYGPMGFDVGAVLENLVLNYLSHYAHTPDPKVRLDYQAYLLDTVREVWMEFARKFESSVGGE